MKISYIYLPVNFNNGNPMTPVHDYLKEYLVPRFGGYTASEAVGGYVMESGELKEEPVLIYQVIFEDSNKTRKALRSLASYICLTGEQESVLLIIDGKPEFVSPC